MANAYRVDVGDNVSWLDPSPVTWKVAKVTAVTDQNTLTLAIRESDGSLFSLGTVLKRTSSEETNVWRPY